ncbi:glycosyltransferase family 39 protein [Nonomuraea sp. NPDC050310]|uniref:glycosyltransferase family 39 protein n=1 Tax=Nonomuraea sp. NPDC050310 TaxID=3154935 RepID=UPI0033E547F9
MTSAPTIARPESARRRRPAVPLWPFPAVAAGVIALAGSTTPTLNGDELATLSAARRSVSGLWTLAQHIDGHFLPYYLFMHLWQFAGESVLWLRLPSILAVAVAAGLLTDLGRRVGGPLAGLVAGGLFAVLPSVSYYGAFARPYAFAAAAVVWSFWALHRAVAGEGGSQEEHKDERHEGRSGARRTGRWVVYGCSVLLVGCTHLFAVLVLPAHLLLARRTTVVRLVTALAAGSVPALALGVLGYRERHAISWIPQRGPDVLLKYPDMVAGAALPGLLLFAAALLPLVLLRKRSPWWAYGWLLLPPLLLLATSHLLTPVYVDRYLFVAAPALALLAALGVTALPRPVNAVASALVAVAAVGLAVPTHLELREPNGRFDNLPWAISRIDAEPGDALVYGHSQLRTGFEYYGGRLPDDVLKLGPDPRPGGFSFDERPAAPEVFEKHERVWLVWRGDRKAAARLRRVAEVEAAGFEQARSWHSGDSPGLTVALYTRS